MSWYLEDVASDVIPRAGVADALADALTPFVEYTYRGHWLDWLAKPLSPEYQRGKAASLGSPLARRLLRSAASRLSPEAAETAFQEVLDEVIEGKQRTPSWAFPLPARSHTFADADPDFGSVSGYLFGILRFLCIAEYERRKHETLDEGTEAPAVAGHSAPVARLLAREWLEILDAILEIGKQTPPPGHVAFGRECDQRPVLAYLWYLAQLAADRADDALIGRLLHRHRILDEAAPAPVPAGDGSGRGENGEERRWAPRDKEASDPGRADDMVIEDDRVAADQVDETIPPSPRKPPVLTVERLVIPSDVAALYYRLRRLEEPAYLRRNAADDFDRAFNAFFWRVIGDHGLGTPDASNYDRAWAAMTRTSPATVEDHARWDEQIGRLRSILSTHNEQMWRAARGARGDPPRPGRPMNNDRALFGPIAVESAGVLDPEAIMTNGQLLALARRLEWVALLAMMEKDLRLMPPTQYWRGSR